MQVGLLDTGQGQEFLFRQTASVITSHKVSMISKPQETHKVPVRPTAIKPSLVSVSSKDVRTENKQSSTLCLSVDTTNCSERPTQADAKLKKLAGKVLMVQGNNPSPISASAPVSARLTAFLPATGSPYLAKHIRKPSLPKKEFVAPSKIGERVKVFQSLVLSSRSLLKESYSMEVSVPTVNPVRPEIASITARESQNKPYLGGLGFGGRVVGKGGMWLGRWESFKATEAVTTKQKDGNPTGYLQHPAYLKRRSSRNQLTSRPQNRHQARQAPEELSKEYQNNPFANEVENQKQQSKRIFDEKYLKILLERRDMQTECDPTRIAKREPKGFSHDLFSKGRENNETSEIYLEGVSRPKHLFKLNNLAKVVDSRGLHFVSKIPQHNCEQQHVQDSYPKIGQEDSAIQAAATDLRSQNKPNQICYSDRCFESKDSIPYSWVASSTKKPAWRPQQIRGSKDKVREPAAQARRRDAAGGQKDGGDKYRSEPQLARMAESPRDAQRRGPRTRSPADESIGSWKGGDLLPDDGPSVADSHDL